MRQTPFHQPSSGTFCERPTWEKGLLAGLLSASLTATACRAEDLAPAEKPRQPDILLIITDDLSHPHWSGAGCSWVRTPNLDALAASGVTFANAYVQAPSCAPSRASLLTGRSPWQLGPGMVLWGEFPGQFITYPRALARAGYGIGRFGKGWGPGRGFLDNNPAGPNLNKMKRPNSLSQWPYDTPGDFSNFLGSLQPGQPFCAWMGFEEPHRPFPPEAYKAAGIDPQNIEVPPFLPDTPEVRIDLANYAASIEFFDEQLGRLLDILRWQGRLDNTLIMVTSDNGMPFPRAKVTTYDYGIHVPLVVSWKDKIPPGRVIEDVVTVTDLMPTILAATGVAIPEGVTGRNLLPLLESDKSGQVNPEWTWMLAGLERHNFAFHSPERTLRSGKWLYVRHLAPESPKDDGGQSPSFSAVSDLPADHPLQPLYAIRKGKMPAEELFDLKADPYCLNNLADQPEHADTLKKLSQQIEQQLAAEGDPRSRGQGYIFGFFPTFKFNQETDYRYEVLPTVE